MSWDWEGGGGGGDYGSFDSYSGGSWDPVDYDFGSYSQPSYDYNSSPSYDFSMPQTPSFTGDIQSGAGMQYDPISNGWINSQGGQVGVGGAPMGGGGFGAGGGFPQPQMGGQPQGGGMGGPQGGGAYPWLAGALGAAGPLMGLIGNLASGGQGQTTMPKMGTAQIAQMNQANQALQPFATGQSPLQQMQMSLLQALQNGSGLPPGYQQLIEQAFQPQMGDLYTQAANQGRARGFHDAPATSPPGGAILGPGLANMQGQMAQAKLGLMQSLPGLYNQPIATAAGAAGNQSQSLLNAVRLGTGQTNSQPIGSQIGQGLGSVISGAAQGYGAQQTQQAQQNSNAMLAELMRRSSTNSSLSGAV